MLYMDMHFSNYAKVDWAHQPVHFGKYTFDELQNMPAREVSVLVKDSEDHYFLIEGSVYTYCCLKEHRDSVLTLEVSRVVWVWWDAGLVDECELPPIDELDIIDWPGGQLLYEVEAAAVMSVTSTAHEDGQAVALCTVLDPELD